MSAKQYLCERSCFHGGRFYGTGEVAEFADDYPKDRKGRLRHFIEIGKQADGDAGDAGNSGMTVKEILAKLAELGVDPGTAKKKDELLALLDGAQKGKQ